MLWQPNALFFFFPFFSNPLKFFSSVSVSQVKLEEALTQATDFHNSLQDFINWLTQAEQTLNMVSPASLILETIMFQIDEHKVTLRSGKVLLTDDFLFTSCDCFASCCGQLEYWENVRASRCKCSSILLPCVSTRAAMSQRYQLCRQHKFRSMRFLIAFVNC